MLKDRIKSNLAAAHRSSIQDRDLGKAAVAVVVVDDPDDANSPYFLLTRRAANMRKHAGQFALPGGKVDKGESIQQAALREVYEELGLTVSEQDVLGMLDDYPTRSGFCITPIVVWVNSAENIQPNPTEVAQVFHIPIDDLHHSDLVTLEVGENPENPVFSVNLSTIGHEIYAPTAAIIYQFFELAIQGNERRVAFYDEPKFAWE